LSDPLNNPTLIRGIGTNFESKQFQVGGSISLPTINGQSHRGDIAEIRGPEELILKRPFKAKSALFQLTGRTNISDDGEFTGDKADQDLSGFKGTKFKTAPHVAQTK